MYVIGRFDRVPTIPHDISQSSNGLITRIDDTDEKHRAIASFRIFSVFQCHFISSLPCEKDHRRYACNSRSVLHSIDILSLPCANVRKGKFVRGGEKRDKLFS